ncbi:acetyl-CoA carboxylase carboxyltransferase subunit alpha [Taibaiella lutea]|uniref:Acetyl-coenzyme A carboxylase carboxyl transferase subunit alpha n=1 Tax=Taibaiella lutea TaxID=2608001 RepID=A0A5M6CKH2_9BACT|nr:acetyl-CoA carboxylase carboxyltransferase subunit alpha [Taibaiella lutea]KAA5533629.1 acetyl-CoA carboxylase carboxyltransferase subunit alpha [Taibaiella lutea]
MQFLDFEKPLEELNSQLEKIKVLAEKNHVDMSASVTQLETSIEETRAHIYKNLTPWQRVQLSRHPERPYTNYYISRMCNKFTELFGDRNVGDDKAIVGGFAEIDGEKIMLIGHQKGTNTKMRQLRNFGMANPEGYRKALRLMKMAEKFNRPILTLIDTPGAFPGLEAEERGQGEAIARNLFEMINLKVPVICIIIGEGASGGALGIGIGDRVVMLENTWYTVISPENCSTILWRSWDYKVQAAEQLHLTSTDMSGFGLVDDVLREPVGGAHSQPDEMANSLKEYVLKTLAELKKINPEKRIEQRIEKFSNMGFYEEL